MSIAFNDRPKVVLNAGRHGEKFWDEEKNNSGLKLMQQMGWQRGKGLGRNESGSTVFVRSKLKVDQKGIGLTDPNKDEVWTATQDLYNNLLQRLQTDSDNGNVEQNVVEKAKVEANTTQSNTAALNNFRAQRTLYSKFKRAKDMSSWSSTALSEVFGKKAPQTPTPTPSPSPANEGRISPASPESKDFVTKTSTVNLKDYFAKKLQGKPGIPSSLCSATSPSSTTSASSSSSSSFTSISQQEYFDRMTAISASQGKSMSNAPVPGGGHFGLGFASAQQSFSSASNNDDNEMVRRIREAAACTSTVNTSQSKKSMKDDESDSATVTDSAANDSEKSATDVDAEQMRQKLARKEAKRLRRLAKQQAEESQTVEKEAKGVQEKDCEKSEMPNKKKQKIDASMNASNAHDTDERQTREEVEKQHTAEESEHERKLRKQKRKEEKRRLKEQQERQAQEQMEADSKDESRKMSIESSDESEEKKKRKKKKNKKDKQMDESA